MGIPTRFNPLGISKGSRIPSDFIVYASCSEYMTTCETGQTITYDNTSASNFTTFAGIPCLNSSNGRRGMRITEPSINQGTNTDRSYSGWLAMTGGTTNQRGIAIGSYSSSKELCSPNNLSSGGGKIGAGGYAQDYYTNIEVGRAWRHYVQTYDGTNHILKLYVDGVLVETRNNFTVDINNTIFSIGEPTNSTSNSFTGYAAGARLYNRVLDAEEVLKLSREFTPHYTITANDLNCSFYQKNETFGITYTSPMTPTFEIIEGTLPSTISFNTSTGQFTGKGLTDEDHTYNLKVRITADKSDSAECNVVIRTYKTARISITSKTFSFYTDGSANDTFSYTSDESVSFAIDSGTLPTGITMSGNRFYSDGTTPVGSYSVVVRGTSAHNQTGVTSTMRFNVEANVITVTTTSLKFFVDKGETTKKIAYSTNHYAITPVYSMSGTLPNGITFNSATGEFTSDATQTSATSGTVQVTVESSTGYSTAGTKSINIIVEMSGEDPIIEDGLSMFVPFFNNYNTVDGNVDLTLLDNDAGEPTFTTIQGIPCIYMTGGQTLYNNTNAGDLVSWFNGTDGKPVFTCSFWVKVKDKALNTNYPWLAFGADGSSLTYKKEGALIKTDTSSRYLSYEQSGHWGNNITNVDSANWNHIAIVSSVSGSSVVLTGYVNGVRHGSNSRSYNFMMTHVFSINQYALGNNASTVTWNSSTCDWYLSGLRVYNRVLTDAEIAQLAAEFTPTP